MCNWRYFVSPMWGAVHSNNKTKDAKDAEMARGADLQNQLDAKTKEVDKMDSDYANEDVVKNIQRVMDKDVKAKRTIKSLRIPLNTGTGGDVGINTTA